MQSIVTPENTMLLDKLLRTFKCEYITFDTTSILTLQTVSLNLAQYTLVRIEPSFFHSYRPLNKAASIPFQRFYRANMRQLRIDQAGDTTVLEYTFDAFTYTKNIHNIDVEPFEPDFVPRHTVRADLLCIKKLVERVKDRFITLCIGRDVQIEYRGTLIKLDSGVKCDENIYLRAETEPFRNTMHHSDLFSDHTLVLSDDGDTLNVIFRGPDLFLSVFMTVDLVDGGHARGE